MRACVRQLCCASEFACAWRQAESASKGVQYSLRLPAEQQVRQLQVVFDAVRAAALPPPTNGADQRVAVSRAQMSADLTAISARVSAETGAIVSEVSAPACVAALCLMSRSQSRHVLCIKASCGGMGLMVLCKQDRDALTLCLLSDGCGRRHGLRQWTVRKWRIGRVHC